jgi:aryl-alcohol dehydrogenase-like predicted oxidoreductase
MEYRLFSGTGVKVSPICLGAMNFGGVTNEDDSTRIIHAALDAGINFIDTANVYNAGNSEVVVGHALRGRRDKVFLATKAHGKMGDGPNDEGLSRLHLMRAVDESLKRLGTDYIDLYQMHRARPETAIDETLSALTDIVRSGKVRYVGCSTHPAWMVMEALAVSAQKNYVRYVSEQPPYNLLDRRIENELVPLALRYQLAIIPWAPIAQGVLAGRYKPNEPLDPTSRAARLATSIYAERVTQRGLEAGARFAEFAQKVGKTAGQLALLWCKDQPGITAPIYGPRTLEQLNDVLPVLNMTLSNEERAFCDELNPPGSVVVNFHNTAPWMKMKIA